MIEVVLSQPLYVLLTNLLEKLVFIPKYMVIVQTLDRPHLMTPDEAILLSSEPDTMAAVHYKPSVYRDTPMSRQKAVE